MLKALQKALEEIAQDTAIKAVILAANGSVFSAGHDLKEVRAIADDYDKVHDLFLRCSEVMLSMTRLPQPVIAKVRNRDRRRRQLVASCDLAIAAETAMSQRQVLISGSCSTPAVAISRVIGRKHAMEMLLSGDMFSAEDACRFGGLTKLSLVMTWMYLYGRPPKISPAGHFDDLHGQEGFYRQLGMDLNDAYSCTVRSWHVT